MARALASPTGGRNLAIPDSPPAAALPSVSVIVPAFNEERTLDPLLHRLLAVSAGAWDVLVVNDGSTDATDAVMQRWADAPGVRLFRHATNRGKGAAVRTALAHATGDVVVIQDADLEYDPADLPGLLAEFRDERVQVVYGARYGRHARHRWTRFRVAVSLLNGLVWLLYGRRLHDEATCYKLLRRPLMTSLELRSNRFELCAEITGKVCQRGIVIRERPISYRPRSYADGKKIGVSAFVRCLSELVWWRFIGDVKPRYACSPRTGFEGRR
jgi:glycosyltransferase involved in cell wall biosynthesis